MTEVGTDHPVEFKDRKTGLIGFGVLLIILGSLSALAVPLLLLASLTVKSMANVPQMSMRMMLPGMAMYSAIAAIFITLGIGSIKCRRWARALILVLSSFWLVTGIQTALMMAFLMPKLGMPHMPEGIRTFTLVFTVCLCSLFGVILPSSLVLFYRSKHVKATCEANDPVVRWTDRRPLPILALTFMLVSSAVIGLFALASPSIIPFFGIYLNGVPATAIRLLMAVVYGYCAYSCYNLEKRGWWLALGCYSLSSISTILTTLLVGLTPMYEAMDLTSAQFEQMRNSGVTKGNWTWISTLVNFILVGGFMIYTKRFFKKTDTED